MMKIFDVVGNAASCDLAVKVDQALRAAIAQDNLNADTGIYGINGMSGKSTAILSIRLCGHLMMHAISKSGHGWGRLCVPPFTAIK